MALTSLTSLNSLTSPFAKVELIYLLLDILPKSRQRAKALFAFLPFCLFPFINSLAACLQSSAAASLLALPATRAYTR